MADNIFLNVSGDETTVEILSFSFDGDTGASGVRAFSVTMHADTAMMDLLRPGKELGSVTVTFSGRQEVFTSVTVVAVSVSDAQAPIMNVTFDYAAVTSPTPLPHPPLPPDK